MTEWPGRAAIARHSSEPVGEGDRPGRPGFWTPSGDRARWQHRAHAAPPPLALSLHLWRRADRAGGLAACGPHPVLWMPARRARTCDGCSRACAAPGSRPTWSSTASKARQPRFRDHGRHVARSTDALFYGHWLEARGTARSRPAHAAGRGGRPGESLLNWGPCGGRHRCTVALSQRLRAPDGGGQHRAMGSWNERLLIRWSEP